jgi:hypothetical protein
VIAAVASPASLTLACEMVEVDPLLGREGTEKRKMSLSVRRGSVAASGWEERLGSRALRLYRQGRGWLIEGNFDASPFASRTLAKLTRAAGGTYALEWGVGEQRGKQGRSTYSILARGHCRQTSGAPLTGIQE